MIGLVAASAQQPLHPGLREASPAAVASLLQAEHPSQHAVWLRGAWLPIASHSCANLICWCARGFVSRSEEFVWVA